MCSSVIFLKIDPNEVTISWSSLLLIDESKKEPTLDPLRNINTWSTTVLQKKISLRGVRLMTSELWKHKLLSNQK